MAIRTRSRVVTGDTISTVATRSQYRNGTTSVPFPSPATTLLTTYTGSCVVSSSNEMMVDECDPEFRKKRDKGVICNNPMTHTRTTITKIPLTVSRDLQVCCLMRNAQGVYIPVMQNAGFLWQGTFTPEYFLTGSYPSAPALDVQSLRTQALQAAYANCNVSEIEGLATLYEGRETIQGLTSIAKRWYNLIRALRKADLRSWRKLRRQRGLWKNLTPKALSEQWMEARYVIRPLVYDTASFVNAINAQRLARPPRQTFRGFKGGDATNSSTTWSYAFDSTCKLHKCYSTTSQYTARAGILAALEKLSDASVWGLDRPVEALYEITPLSFVLEWFFNVSQAIAVWTPKFGIRQLASWLVEDLSTIKWARVSLIESVYAATPPNYIQANSVAYSGGQILTHQMTKTRVTNPDVSAWPQFNVRLDASKLLDLAIIIKQMMA